MKVLIVGGAGYIGSTVASCCADHGITPVILDDLSTGRAEYTEGRIAYRGRLGDGALVDRIFADHPDIDAVVLCAAKMVVPESIADPLTYYTVNIAEPIELIRAALRNGCSRLLFSSTAALYEPGEDFSVDEESVPNAQSPYARSKVMLEQILADVAVAEPLRVLSLRYFNPIGSDPKLRTGQQNPRPSHVLGKLIQAHEDGEAFVLAGTDWPTRDGSTIRDYIHVWDLARAHVAALEEFDRVLPPPSGGHEVINLGTGSGTTVRELVGAFEAATGETLRVIEAPRRPGDVIGCFTRTEKAERLLGWRAELSIADGIRDSLAWAEKRPDILGE